MCTISEKICKKILYTSDDYDGLITNTITAASEKAADKLFNILLYAPEKKSFVTLLLSNAWVTSVFYGGVVFVCITCLILGHRKSVKDAVENDSFWFSSCFFTIIFVVLFIAIAVLWMQGPLDVWNYQGGLKRGFFYMRYYGHILGPMVLISCTYLHKRCVTTAALCVIAMMHLFSAKYILVNILQESIANNKLRNDWFGYFAPFSLSIIKRGEDVQQMPYFAVATFVTLLIIIAIIVLYIKKREKFIFFILAVTMLYEYSYSVINWDYVFSNGDTYYGGVNELLRIREASDVFEGRRMICYNNALATQYVTQFILYDTVVINFIPDQLQDTDVFFMSSFDDFRQMRFKHPDYTGYILDDNEYILSADETMGNVLVNLDYNKYEK